MNPSSTLPDNVGVYGTQATYKELPTGDDLTGGVVPLDTLPANWWNALWNQTTTQLNSILAMVTSLANEVYTVLDNAGIEPSASSVSQLNAAINKLQQHIATVTTPGSVISASDIKSVSVDEGTGKMTVNALTDWEGTNTVKEKFESLDVADSAVAGKYVSAVSETDGKIQVTRADLPEAKEMTGATSGTDGTGGTVPAPTAGENEFFLTGNGNWSKLWLKWIEAQSTSNLSSIALMLGNSVHALAGGAGSSVTAKSATRLIPETGDVPSSPIGTDAHGNLCIGRWKICHIHSDSQASFRREIAACGITNYGLFPCIMMRGVVLYVTIFIEENPAFNRCYGSCIRHAPSVNVEVDYWSEDTPMDLLLFIDGTIHG